MSLFALAATFALTAMLYAAVGFGGGSTYTALLAWAEVDYRLIPVVALGCNIVVVSGGVFHFARGGHLRSANILPFVCTSIPLAAVGGALPVSQQLFFGLLGGALLVSGLLLLLQPGQVRLRSLSDSQRWLFGLPSGAAIGFLAGVVGIGGGIFLAPLLHLVGWARSREIAATASGFILLNSVAGLLGQASKLERSAAGASPWWPSEWLAPFGLLLLAVLVGGQIGSYLAVGKLNPHWIRRLTALLVLYVALRLLLRAFG